MINASFILGLDGDTKETFDATLKWIVDNKIRKFGKLSEKICNLLTFEK